MNTYYNGGMNGWGNMITECKCGCIVREEECDSNGLPVKTLFDWEEEHMKECDEWYKQEV